MKKHYFLFWMLPAVFLACKKDPKLPDPVEPPVVVVPKDTTKTDKGIKTKKIDSIRKAVLLRSTRSIFDISSDSVWKDSTGITFRVEMKDPETSVTLSPSADYNQVFPGSLIRGKSVDDFSFKPLTGYGAPFLNIIPTDHTFDLVDKMSISKKSFDDYIRKQLTRGGSEQIESAFFSSGDPFENYAEISIYSRYSWDISNFLNLKPGENRKIKKKNGLYSTLDMSLFSITAYALPDGNFFAPGTNPTAVPDDPLVVRDVTYGRMATIAIESDASFKEIHAAFAAARTKNMSAEHRSLLQNAIVTPFVRGFNVDRMNQLKNFKGAELVEKYLELIESGGTVSVNDYGAPIKVLLSKADLWEGPFYRHHFKYRLDYPVN